MTEDEVPRKPQITAAQIEAAIEQAALTYMLALNGGFVNDARECGRFLARLCHHLHRARYDERQTRT